MRAYDPGKIGCYAGWRRYEKNPIIGERVRAVRASLQTRRTKRTR